MCFSAFSFKYLHFPITSFPPANINPWLLVLNFNKISVTKTCWFILGAPKFAEQLNEVMSIHVRK
jgi:hypothetical protein